MELIISLVVCGLLSWLLRKPLKKCPGVFYAIAVVTSYLFVSNILLGAMPVVGRALYPYWQRCLLGFGFLCVVMFIGALPASSKIRSGLMPVRGELSIMASLLVAGHVANYLDSYLAQIMRGFLGLSLPRAASLVIAMVLAVLLVLLAVTSIKAIRTKMDKVSWKRLQWFAYPFFILTFVHIFLILGPSASSLGQRAGISIAIYGVIGILYIVMKGLHIARNKKAHQGESSKETEAA